MLDLDPQSVAILEKYHFDRERFASQEALLSRNRFTPAMAQTQDTVEPLRQDELTELPAVGSEAHQHLARQGEAAIKNGEVACLLLNGGMATRFGGIAKGAATAYKGRSFLGLRIGQILDVAQKLRASVPVVLMNSFATDDATVVHLREHHDFDVPEGDLLRCLQGISVRLTEDGRIFRPADGKPSFYAPGHGDLPWALAHSGVSKQLQDRGIKTVFVSNVDNLGCTFDPAIIGAHVEAGKPMTAETVVRQPSDVGGAPARVAGRPQLIEGFRLPPGFAQERLVGFNTNTFCFSWVGLDPRLPLGFYPVSKKVEGQPCVQFERIVGEVSKSVACQFLQVPRDAEHGRFLPVKTPEDLQSLAPLLAHKYG